MWILTWCGGPYSLNMVSEELHTDAIEKRVRTILPDEETIDPDDRNLLMRTWEINHHHRVAKVMSSLVENCPTLEEIEWASMALPRFFGEPEKRSLWKWKVLQEKRGHYNRRRVSGTFIYTGSPSGDPSVLHILVGEELAWARNRVTRYIFAISSVSLRNSISDTKFIDVVPYSITIRVSLMKPDPFQVAYSPQFLTYEGCPVVP